MRPSTFFRDLSSPSNHGRRQEYERFLLDTYADRRDEDAPPRGSAVSQLARRLRKLVSGDLR